MEEVLEALSKLLKELFEKYAPEWGTYFRLILTSLFVYHREALLRVVLVGVALAVAVLCTLELIKRIKDDFPSVLTDEMPRPAPITAAEAEAQFTNGHPQNRKMDSELRAEIVKHTGTGVGVLGLLLAVLFDWPYAYFVILRVGICTLSVNWAIESIKRRKVFWAWALSANAFLFNPIMPVRMARDDWAIIDIVDAVFLATFVLLSIFQARKHVQPVDKAEVARAGSSKSRN